MSTNELSMVTRVSFQGVPTSPRDTECLLPSEGEIIGSGLLVDPNRAILPPSGVDFNEEILSPSGTVLCERSAADVFSFELSSCTDGPSSRPPVSGLGATKNLSIAYQFLIPNKCVKNKQKRSVLVLTNVTSVLIYNGDHLYMRKDNLINFFVSRLYGKKLSGKRLVEKKC